jgi:hypothetical protein
MSGGSFAYIHTRHEFDEIIESLESFIDDRKTNAKSVSAAIKVIKNIKKSRAQMRTYDNMVSGDTSEREFQKEVWDIESLIDSEF